MKLKNFLGGLFKLLFIALLLFGMIMFLLREQLIKKDNLKREIAALEIESRSISHENSLLKKELENSDTLEFVEKVARDEYGLVKPGEIIYIDVNKNAPIEEYIKEGN